MQPAGQTRIANTQQSFLGYAGYSKPNDEWRQPHEPETSSKCRRTQEIKTTGDLSYREVPHGYLRLEIQGKPIHLRKSDCYFNATELVALTDKTDIEIRRIHSLIRDRPKRKVHKMQLYSAGEFCIGQYWVPYCVSQCLCDALGLTKRLNPLLEYGKTMGTPLEDDASVLGVITSYLEKFLIINAGPSKVSIRLRDLWVNATHICHAIDLRKNVAGVLSRHQLSNDWQKTGPVEHQGTYTSPSNALKLCKIFCLAELEQILRARLKERGYREESTVVAGTVVTGMASDARGVPSSSAFPPDSRSAEQTEHMSTERQCPLIDQSHGMFIEGHEPVEACSFFSEWDDANSFLRPFKNSPRDLDS